MAGLSALRQHLGLLLALALASVTLAGVAALPPPPTAERQAVVSLAGSPHLWFTDRAGRLHWGSDTRALAGRWIPWSNRIEISREELCALPADRLGDPWLSAGLLKQGDPIYLVKWETDWAQPQLLHIRSLREVEAFGINESNYGYLVYDVPTWEARYGFSVAELERGVMAPVCAPPTTPTPTPTATPTPKPTDRPAPAPTAGSTGGSTAAPPAPTSGGARLTVSNIGRNTATLILSNYPGNWYYRYTAPAGGQCSTEQTGTTASVTRLDPTTTYTFQAYSDSNCSTALATAASFTTPQKSLTWVSITATAVTLTIAGHSGGWYYQADQAPHTNCSNVVTASNNAVSLTGLTTNTTYKYTAYSDATCSTAIATASAFTTLTPALAAAQSGADVTLTLTNWATADGNWYYRHDQNQTCSGPVSAPTSGTTSTTTATNVLDDVSKTYVFTAYNDNNCNSTKAIAAAPGLTPVATLAASNIGTTSADLTLNLYSGEWYYKADKAPHNTCSSAQSTTTVSLTGLTVNTTYTYTAYSNNTCNTVIVAAAPVTTLYSMAVTAGIFSAKLTLNGRTGNWYYQHAGAGATCSSAVTGDNATATGLTENTSYTFTAYSDSNCSMVIAAAAAVTTVNMDISVVAKDQYSLYVRLSERTAWNTTVDGTVWSFRIVREHANSPLDWCTDADVSNANPSKGGLAVLGRYDVFGHIGRNCQGTAFGSVSDFYLAP